MLTPCFPPFTIVGAGEVADGSVARAVGKKRGAEGQDRAVRDVAAADTPDAGGVHIHSISVVRHIYIHARIPQYFLLLPVFELLAGVGVLAFLVAEFLDQVTQVGIRIQLDAPAQVHADLGAVVAAKHGTIVHNGHLKPLPGRRHRSADT